MSVEASKYNEYSTNEELNEFFSKEMKELANSVPEMNETEIKQLTGPQLHDIFLQSEGTTYQDKIGKYIIVNLNDKKRKLYYTLGKPLEDGHTYIYTNTIENTDYKISIGRKSGNKIVGVYADIINTNGKNIHRGNLIYKNGEFLPKK